MITEVLAGAEIAVVGGALGRQDGRPRALGAFGEVFLGLLLAAAPGLREVRVLGLARAPAERLARRLGDRRVRFGTRPARGTAVIVHLGVGGALATDPHRLAAMLRATDDAVVAARHAPGARVIHVGSLLATGGKLAFGDEAERAFLDRIVRSPLAAGGHGAGPLRWRADGLGFVSAGAWAQAVAEASLATYVSPERLTRVRMPLLEPSYALPVPGFCGRATALAPLCWALGAPLGTVRQLPCDGRLPVPVLPLDVAAGQLVAILARAVAEKKGGAYAIGAGAGAGLTWERVVELTNLAARPASEARGWGRIWQDLRRTEAEVVAPLTPPEPSPEPSPEASEGPWEPTRAPPSLAARQITERYGALFTRGFPRAEAAEVAALTALEGTLAPSERALLGPAFTWRGYWLGALYPGLVARVFPRFDRRALRRSHEAARGERVR
jgi:hypothetical protein